MFAVNFFPLSPLALTQTALAAPGLRQEAIGELALIVLGQTYLFFDSAKKQ